MQVWRKRSSEKALVAGEETRLAEACAVYRAMRDQELDRKAAEIACWYANPRCKGKCKCKDIDEAIYQHRWGIVSEIAKGYDTERVEEPMLLASPGYLYINYGKDAPPVKPYRSELANEAFRMAIARYHRMDWANREKPYGLYVWLRNNTRSCAAYLVRKAAADRKRRKCEQDIAPAPDWSSIPWGWENEVGLLKLGMKSKDIVLMLHGPEKMADAEWLKREVNRIDQRRRRMKQGAKIRIRK